MMFVKRQGALQMLFNRDEWWCGSALSLQRCVKPARVQVETELVHILEHCTAQPGRTVKLDPRERHSAGVATVGNYVKKRTVKSVDT